MLFKTTCLLIYFSLSNFSINKFYDLVLISLILLIFFVSEKKNNNKKYIIVLTFLLLSFPINSYLKKIVIYEGFNGFKLPLYETVDPNKLNSKIALDNKNIYIFFKENYLYGDQTINLVLKKNNIDIQLNFDINLLNLKTDKHILKSLNQNFFEYEGEIDKFNWVGITKNNFHQNKKLIWIDQNFYKLSDIKNSFSQRNIFKEKLPEELYSQFKKQTLKEYKKFYSGTHPPEYKNHIKMTHWSFLPNKLFYPTKDIIFDNKENYSRKIYDIKFHSLESHNLPFVNDYKLWNFSHNDNFIFRATNYPNKRALIPYFTSYQFNENHIGAELCWQGYMYKKQEKIYNMFFSEQQKCLDLDKKNIKNKIYFSSIDKSNILKIKLNKNFSHNLISNSIFFLKIIFLFYLFYLFIEKRNLKRFLFYLLLLIASYSIIFILERDFSFGYYEPLGAWDDGIAHENFSLDMIKNSLSGNWTEVFRGGEDLYDNTMLMRYINYGEKFVFGETKIFQVLLALFLPFMIFKFYRKSVSFITTSIFFFIFFFKGVEKIIFPGLRSLGGSYINTVENLGVAYYEWVHLFAWNYEEAIGFFTILIALLLSQNNIKKNTLFRTFLIGLIFSVSALFRLNYAPVGAVFLSYFGLKYLYEKKFLNLLALIAGFSFVILYFYHNLYFASTLSIFEDHLTRSWVALPLNTYPMALIDLLKLNLDSDHINLLTKKISEVFYDFNVVFLTISFLFLLQFKFFKKMNTFEKLLQLSTFIMFLLMFYYMSYERYSYLTWFLIFFLVLNGLEKFYFKINKNFNKRLDSFKKFTYDLN